MAGNEKLGVSFARASIEQALRYLADGRPIDLVAVELEAARTALGPAPASPSPEREATSRRAREQALRGGNSGRDHLIAADAYAAVGKLIDDRLSASRGEQQDSPAQAEVAEEERPMNYGEGDQGAYDRLPAPEDK